MTSKQVRDYLAQQDWIMSIDPIDPLLTHSTKKNRKINIANKSKSRYVPQQISRELNDTINKRLGLYYERKG